jgi:hypothetical protein
MAKRPALPTDEVNEGTSALQPSTADIEQPARNTRIAATFA